MVAFSSSLFSPLRVGESFGAQIVPSDGSRLFRGLRMMGAVVLLSISCSALFFLAQFKKKEKKAEFLATHYLHDFESGLDKLE